MSVATIGVAGAGTMGAGIAQLACLGGYEAILHDPQPAALARGVDAVTANLERGVSRDRWSSAEAAEARARLHAAPESEALAACGLVIEAAPEDLELKRELFARLEALCEPATVLATNTSSLPVSAIAANADHPERICGMHFFNPPALMKLVEVVAGARSGEPALESVVAVAERMGRTAIRCTDSPGFIVNRCNRPFALESLRMLDAGLADAAEIDVIVREDGGYPMGPFELIDLIGVDVNLEVARSFYRQRAEPRWRPHPIQERLVAEGRLGRKAGRGFHAYDERGARRVVPADPDPEIRREVLERLLAQLANEACFAAEEGVATAAEIDAAIKLGLNHPRGPFESARELGPHRALAILDGLGGLGDEAYRASAMLRRWATDPASAP